MTQFTLTQSGTYAIWFYCTQNVPTSGNSQFFLPFLVQRQSTYVATTVGINNLTGSGTTLVINRINVGGQYVGIGSGTFQTNTWNHFAIVVSNTSSGNWSLKSYLNGGLLSNTTSTTVYQSTATSTSYIGSGGQSFNESVNQHFVGYVDDFRAYNYALSATQVLAIFNKDGA
jgi:hypothetical protein